MSGTVTQAEARELLRRARSMVPTHGHLASALGIRNGGLSAMLTGKRPVSHHVAREMGVSLPPPLPRGRRPGAPVPARLTSEQIETARSMRQAGEPLRVIAQALGVTEACVCQRTRGYVGVSQGINAARACAARAGVNVPLDLAAAYVAERRATPQLTAAEAMNSVTVSIRRAA